VATARELGYYLSRFAALGSYPVGYLATHGTRGGVWVGNERISIETLTAWSSSIEKAPSLDGHGKPKDWVLDLSGKVLYLGSCATLDVTEERLERLREATGLVALCGYTKPVDWFASGGFDVILLSALADAMNGARPRERVRNRIRRLWRDGGSFLETLGFRCVPNWRP